ncbi:MAG: Crp/Fnr family transcriptional regulator [Bacteroidales bacterium]
MSCFEQRPYATTCDHRGVGDRKMHSFDAQAFLDSAGVARKIIDYRRSETIFSQGDAGDSVIYIQRGGVKLSVVSKVGREAIVAMLGPGDFCGEGGLAGQSVRMATATALTPTTALVIEKDEMIRVLHAEHALSDRFITYVLSRNIRIEEDLVAQLFNSNEKRLARALLLLARYGKEDTPRRVLPRLSQATLADMSGTTQSRVTDFMAKFKRLGFIEDSGAGIKVNNSLLNVVLHD